MERLETQTCNGDSTSFEKEMLALLDEQIFLTDSVFARLPMGVEIYDASGILRCLNERARLMYGVKLDAVINKVNLFESPYVDEALLARIQSGDDIVLEFEYDFDRMNKEYFHTSNKDTIIYEVKIVPITNKQGTIVGHILLTNDVTSTKEAEYRTEESKKNLEMAMEAANMSSWVYDVYKMEFGILHGNSVFKSGMSLEQLLPMLHPQDCVPLRELFSRLINKEVLQGQLTVRVFNEQEGEFRHYESRMRLSTEHFGKLQIVGTLLDVTEKLRMAKKTQDLLVKRELAMKVNDIVHWDFNVQMQTFEAYNDPVNDYASDKLVSLEEYLNVIHPEDRSLVNDALQSMLLGRNMNINLTCRIQTRHDDTWQYCNITGVPFEFGEGGYKALKAILDGSVASTGDNLLVYATSNRRHLMPEKMQDNLASSMGEDGELHPAETIEEKMSLSERFGLWLSFYPFSQKEYLAVAEGWTKHFGGEISDRWQTEALQFALQRGSRSGRVAYQFARDWAGRMLLETEHDN